MNILLTTRLPAEGFQSLQGHNIIIPETPYISKEQLHEYMSDCEVLVPTFDYMVPAELIGQMPKLRLIANFGVGYNNIDIEAAKKYGIRVTNTPEPTIEPTAEHTFALLIGIAHRIAELDRKMRTTTDIIFGVMNNLGTAISNKTLGIIGMGRIGKSVVQKALAFNMNIIYHNRHQLSPEIEQRFNARYVTFNQLLHEADFISLNLPYSPEVHHLIDRQAFQQMKESAILINTARGAIIDEKALIEALSTHRIKAAALDVYEHEPNISPELYQLDNVLLSPHIGTGSMEGRIAMCNNVCENIIAFERQDFSKMNIVV